jgi:hypothetical protein
MRSWKHTDNLREMACLSVSEQKQDFVPWQELLELAVVHYCTILNLTYSSQTFLHPVFSCLTSWWNDQSSKVLICIKQEKSNIFRTVIVLSLEILKFVLQQINQNISVTCFQWKVLLACSTCQLHTHKQTCNTY